MAGPLYARYVPPKTAIAHAAVKNISTASPLLAEPDLTQPESSKWPKRTKESKKRKRDSEDEGDRIQDAPAKHKGVLSKYEKALRRKPAKSAAGAEPQRTSPEPQDEEPHSLSAQGLEPLPQTEQPGEVGYKPSFSALPPWLSNPQSVLSSTVVPLDSLSIDSKLLLRLHNRGYKDAFAVQSAVLPLLLPGEAQHQGDLCVSAATGSGKTLAYILPLVQGLQNMNTTRLRGLIIVPTRELVNQVREVAELCAGGSGLQIGTAVGDHTFKAEQETLVSKGKRYDPERYYELQEKAKRKLLGQIQDGDEDDEDQKILDDCLGILRFHVPEYESKVDILICTPGRLIEHVTNTIGFTLKDLHWLIIDEADKLLGQEYQGWLEAVMDAIRPETDREKMRPNDRLLSMLAHPVEPKHVRKVILSATIKKDLDQLAALKLRRPKLVVVGRDQDPAVLDDEREVAAGGETFDLPATLLEYAVPVEDGVEKPLYLLQLLRSKIILEKSKGDRNAIKEEIEDVDGPRSSTDDSSDYSSSPSSSSERGYSSGSDSRSPSSPASPAGKTGLSEHDSSPSTLPTTVLVFASTTESATRLSRLLTLLDPTLSSKISTLTKSVTSKPSRKALKALGSGTISVLISTDRAARGLDIPSLTHVVNYDVPHSVTGYVHRVGRTARAGREGRAWTLVADREARWFWNDVARTRGIRRMGKVERVKVDGGVLGDEGRKAYERALRELGEEVRKTA